MKLIKIIKSIFTIKFSKKDTLLAVMSVLFSSFFNKLTKQYAIFRILFKYLSLFRRWAFHISIFSLVYSAFAQIFTFKYDYRFFASLTYGLFLVGSEILSEYTDHIFDAWYRLLTKISSKVQDHAGDDSIINKKSADQLKQLAEDKNSRSEPHSYTMKRTYINSEEEYRYYSDWKAWVVVGLISAGIITTFYFYGPDMDTVKGSSKAFYNKLRDYFFGPEGPDGGNTPDSDMNESNKYIDEFNREWDLKTQEHLEFLRNQPVEVQEMPNSPEIPIAAETEVWGEGERNVYFKDAPSTPSSSGTVTPNSESITRINPIASYVWEYDINDPSEKILFLYDYNKTLGKILHYCSQVKKLSDYNIDVLNIPSKEDIALNNMKKHMSRCAVEFVNKWSEHSLAKLTPAEIIIELFNIAKADDSISEVPNTHLMRVVNKLIGK